MKKKYGCVEKGRTEHLVIDNSFQQLNGTFLVGVDQRCWFG